jgi:hypothetical protein
MLLSKITSGPTLFLLFCPIIANATDLPFDITSPLSRNVVIWVDNNVSDPSSVGNNLEFAFDGIWSSDGATGTITVDKDDVISAFATSGLPGTPSNTAGWSDLIVTIDIATGEISSMAQSGTLAISGLGDQPFSYDLNTTRLDVTTSTAYTQTGFADVTFGPELFTGWCTDTNAGQISGLACPAYSGPTPFGYDSITGRFNAIGATNLNSFIFAYSTFGDAQLFEQHPPVPAFSMTMLYVLALALAAIGTYRVRAEPTSA